MTGLPYENATSGKTAVADMQKILRGFGAQSFGVMEDFGRGEVIVQFEHRSRQVTVKANWKGYATAWLKHHPHTFRSRISEAEHQKKALKQAEIAVYSILRDWIKGQITAIEIGALSFEGAFLAQILLPTGETVLERLQETKLLALPGVA